MRKEILVAIIAGLVIGIVIAYGSWRVNSAVSNNTQTAEDKPLEIAQTENQQEEKAPIVASLSFDNLENFQVITDSSFLVSGKTHPGSIVSVSAESEDFVVSSSEDGSFELELPLLSGINQLVTSVFDLTGNQIADNKITVVYTNELPGLYEVTTTPGTSPVQTPEDNVQNPKAILGTVTDKTENSLQIRNLEGKIELVSVTDDTDFARDEKEAAYDDVAIGDFLAVLGFANGSTVHEAKKIILASPIADPSRKIIAGNLSALSSREISVIDASGNETSVSLPRRWKGPNVRDLEEGMMAVLVYDVANEKPTLRTIQIVEITETPLE